MKYRVSEVFGPTIQGEGRQIGAPSVFIRFAGCDYRCSWCDSLHAVLPEYVNKTPFMQHEELVNSVSLLSENNAVNWVVLSGGNPALFNLGHLVEDLQARHFKVMIETQGSIWKDWILACDDICISPKPPSSNNMTHPDELRTLLIGAAGEQTMHKWRMYLKVVVFTDEDYEYAVQVHGMIPWLPMYLSVGNSKPPHPERGDGTPDISSLLSNLKWLAEKVVKDKRMVGVRVLPQMHVLMWGNERGR